MRFGSPEVRPDGSWAVGIHYAGASELVRDFDPDQPFVVVEGHAPIGAGWHALPMPLTSSPAPARTRTGRRVRFDLLISPQEAIDAGPEFDQSDSGWLYAWQTPIPPPPNLTLSDKNDRARAAAMRRIGVMLLIDLPHRAETAVLWSPDHAILEAALDRLRR
jgi:hypothetical protein